MIYILKILKFTKNLIVDKLIFLTITISRKKLNNRLNLGTCGKILFNTQYHWYHSWIDYTLAAALKYRGYKVEVLICDGMPYCEHETATVKRPSCANCYRNTKTKVDLFGLKTIKLSQLVNENKKNDLFNLSNDLSIETLLEYKFLNVDIGKLAYRNFTHYFKGCFKVDSDNELIFRKCIQSALLLCQATNNYLSKKNIEKVITPNGKFIQSGIAVELSKLHNIDFYTWDFFLQNSAAIFGKNTISHDQKIDDLWDEIKQENLNSEQKNKLNMFYDLQSRSLNTPFKYYDEKVINDPETVKSKLSLRENSKIVTLFTNIEWDSTAMGQDLAYKDMFHWVKSMTELAIHNQNIDLIIRAHPGELKVPKHLKTKLGICDRILDEFKTLPTNVKLVYPDDNISSYILSAISSIAMVYSSTLGLEFALKGIRPWIAATPYYSNKGFSVDITSHDQLVEMINNLHINNKLTLTEIEYAKKLAYAIKFRRLVHYPIFNKKGKFRFFSSRILLPNNGKDSDVINNVCNFIEDKRGYLDLGPSAVDH